ncbi:GNAT family N-acetyltransferase [Flavobacterium suncheonense]|uniref:N-acetyltransferase domain-containing protein n=1 Tax=Flavobacterium suncheonense GH29-5 = DSM 17707 TaxID=1121899 RepID=A0A0A2MGB4_9FLAO|nr:GNAT family N-acetyltransferase [Flavobacterium suncheonense]KGO90626.1 hypothetical protein Q764_00445 [Flavobacterium suncheonense GH29-5 = DSM 17707]
MSTATKNFPTLFTERLTLRQLSAADSSEIFRLRSDREINKFLDRKPSQTTEDALNFIKAILESDDTFYWAITQTGEEKLIGTICLFDFVQDTSRCEIGYELLTEFQGHGIMMEAAKKVIQYADETLGIRDVEAVTHKDNQGSVSLLKKLNFNYLGNHEAEHPDLVLFRLTIDQPQ